MAGLSNKLPLGMSGILFLFVLGAGGIRLWNNRGPQMIVPTVALSAYLVWLIAESLLVSVRESSLPETNRDEGSCELYALAQGATVILALLLPWTVTSNSLGSILASLCS